MRLFYPALFDICMESAKFHGPARVRCIRRWGEKCVEVWPVNTTVTIWHDPDGGPLKPTDHWCQWWADASVWPCLPTGSGACWSCRRLFARTLHLELPSRPHLIVFPSSRDKAARQGQQQYPKPRLFAVQWMGSRLSHLLLQRFRQ